MKIKRYILSACAGLAVVVGVAYGVGISMKKKVQPVEVAPVTNLNQADYLGAMDMSTLYGNIISKDTQSVTLDTSHTVKAVYVKAGDKVKKGDSLMTYDMEMDRLKREAEDLTRQGLELQLQTLQKDLATMESGHLPAGYGQEDSSGYSSSDDKISGTSAYSSDDSSDDDTTVDNEDSSTTMSADISPENMDKTGESSVITDDSSAGDGQSDSSDDVVDVPKQDVTDGESSSSGQVIIDETDDSGSTDLRDDQTVIGESSSTVEPDEETLSYVNTFLTDVNKLTGIANNGFDNLNSDEAASLFKEAFTIFRSQLSETGETTVTDFFGQSRTVTVYEVSGMVRGMTGDATSSVLKQAYDRLCVYQFINAVRQIYPGQTNQSDAYDYQSVSAAAYAVHAAADAFYELPASAVSMDETGNIIFSTEFSVLNDPAFGSQNYGQYLEGLIQTMNSTSSTIFPDVIPDQTEQEFTEPDIPDNGGGGDDGYSAEDLQAAIKQQKKDIVNCKLDIRQATLTIKDYDRTLQHETVKATMDGIVKQAGTTTEQPSSGGFIVVTGKAGMYVEGSLSERSLNTLKEGDIISGSSWSGTSFSATITEISQYPSDSTGYDYFSYDSTGDKNSSQYPFLAYIDDAEDLQAGDGVQLSIDGSTDSGGLMLYPFMIRIDTDGRSFCYVRGKGGKLEKRVVKTKDTDYGVVRILAGLRASDYIAFPYGDDVKEGAPTKKVDSLSAVSGDSYAGY